MVSISNSIRNIIGDNIVYFRLKADWSQENLAELLETTPAYLSQLENGKRNITADYLEKLAKVFKIEPYQLLLERPPLKNRRIDRIKS